MLDDYEAVDNYVPARPGFTSRQITLVEPRQKAWIYYYDGDVDGKKPLEHNPWV